MSSKVKAFVGYRRISSKASIASSGRTMDARQSMENILKDIQSVVNSIEGATSDALFYALEPIFDKSQEYCPVDTGALKESGYLETDQEGDRITAVIGYAAGNNPPYAIFVHEMIELHHEPPTRAKFLQSAIDEGFSQIQPRILEYLKRVTGV